MKKFNKKQEGFTIIELLIIISVIGFITLLNMQNDKQVRSEDEARSIGHQLAVYNNAVRSHISVNLNNEDYINNGDTTFNGVNWLKNEDQCDSGESSSYFLPCEFPEFIGKTNLTYTTIIYSNSRAGSLRAKTVIDIKSQNGSSTQIGSTQVGLAMLAASGGKNSDLLMLSADDTTLQLDENNIASTNIILTNTDSNYLYCPFGVDIAFLNNECSVTGNIIEDGLIVMIAETSGENDSLIRVDGSNTMQNKLRMEASESAQREIIGVSSIYNLTGEILKLGNSGIYFEDSWVPIIGDGLVIDTDVKVIGNSIIKGDINNSGDLIANTNLISERAVLAGREIITEGDSETIGNQFILGSANYNSNLDIFGTLDAAMINVRTFIESNEISAANNINSDTIINAPVIRAASSMFSDGGLVVSGDTITSGNSYVAGNRAVSGSIATEGDIIANSGNTYLGNVFASAIFDADGDYLIHPSGISRTNITRAEKIVSSTSGSTLGLNGNRILFAREDISCVTASEDCATKVGGYVDMEKVMIKSPGDGRWISFVQYLNGLETYIRDQNKDD